MQSEATIRDELKRIAVRNDGILTAEAVVNAARNEDSPLHSSFTWDNTEAACKWRLHQARNLILRVKVEVADAKEHTVTIREWTSLTPDRLEEGGGYREVVRVMRNADQRAQLLADALAELDRISEKYRTLSELSEVFEAIKTARRRSGMD
jgi:hypothetical protein